MGTFERRYGDRLKEFVEEFLTFDSTRRNEKPAQEWFETKLKEFGFETYVWEADEGALSSIRSFPDANEIDAEERPSVGGVLEFGDPDAGSTLVLNGHVDVVPVEETSWQRDPFDPTWEGDRLIARGAADMKSGLSMLVFVAMYLREEAGDDLDGRIVVESVTGEEEGGIGAPAAALENPYPFDRDAAIVAEPTDLDVVTTTAGVFTAELEVYGRSAHAATRWRGESVLSRFERIRRAFEDLESERDARLTHPLYEYPISWPVNVGVVESGSWVSNVPAKLSAKVRIGYAPGETMEEVKGEFDERLETLAGEDEWLASNPPKFEQYGVYFEPSEVRSETEIVRTLQETLEERGRTDTGPVGKTYSADSRFYNEAGIPSVLFGPGSVEQAHFPDEYVYWPEVLEAAEVVSETARTYLEADVNAEK